MLPVREELPGIVILLFLALQNSPQQLIREGKLEDALEAYRGAPKSAAASTGAGIVLDLMGRYTEARSYFEQSIRAAPTLAERARAQRDMAISYGFTRDCRGAEKYGRPAYQYFLSTGDYYDAGEAADELGRLCLDAGDLDRAWNWYQRGHEAGSQEPDIGPAHADLWSFRWAHARARLTVRRGKPEEARKYVARARAILDKGANPDQEAYFPYLTGYVAFYSGDFAAALKDLQDAPQNDPFIQCLLGQTYEKLGDREKAMEYYRKAAGATAHSVPVAFARPFARSKLE